MKFNIHDNIENDQNRFVLGCSGSPTLFVLGINPSTANKEKSDATITKVANFSKQIGFNGFVMLNIYPQRATNPDELHPKVDSKLVAQNEITICSIIPKTRHPQIWAAWGDSIRKRDYLWDTLFNLAKKLEEQFHPIWKHCGTPTKLGHPRHPSRLAYKEKFFEFKINDYLDKKRIV